MTGACMQAPSLTPPSRRLVVGILVSVLAHSLGIIVVHPLAVAFPPARSLSVEILGTAEIPETSIVAAGQSEFSTEYARAQRPADETPPSAQRNISETPLEGLDVPIAPDRYYNSREVDVRAEPVNDITLVYPQFAYQQRIKGMVLLRILINERGAVDDVSVIDSAPKGMFEEAALKAALALQFSPAILRQRPVKSLKVVEVEFDPYQNIHIP